MSEESLMQAPQEPAPDTEGQPEGEAASWSWNDDLPGTGDAPDWFKAGKYKSIADQAKAYNDLEGKFGSFTGAPENYEIPEPSAFADSIELPEGVEFSIDKDDPLLESFAAEAKEMGINQEGFNKLVGLYIQQQARDYADSMTTADAERARLGDNAADRINSVNQWAKANLDAETYEKVVGLATTADAIEALEQLIGKTRNANMPDPKAVAPAPAFTAEEARALQGERDANGRLKIETDPAHRAKVKRAFESVFGTEPERKVIGG